MSCLTPRESALVSIGAAIASNCVPCIQFHVPAARKAGLTTEQISEATALADQVRRVPAQKVLDAARELLAGDAPDAAAGPKDCCAGVAGMTRSCRSGP